MRVLKNRPSRHVRRVKTKKGRRMRVINPEIKKRRRSRGYVLINSQGKIIKTKEGSLTPFFTLPIQAHKYAESKGMKHAKIHGVGNYGSLFHGTSEEALAKMPLTGGLKPNKGKLYLTTDPRYARLRARMATKNTKFKPVILEVKDAQDITREGRHYVLTRSVPSRNIKVV